MPFIDRFKTWLFIFKSESLLKKKKKKGRKQNLQEYLIEALTVALVAFSHIYRPLYNFRHFSG